MAEQKLSGIEMMMNSLLKAAGFDPRIIADNVVKTVKEFQDATAALQHRLDAVDLHLMENNARLERIELALEIRRESVDTDTAPRRLTSG